jgi:poly-gamma-glutamate capsule biosynthesis protein CapA/YwtB (metallophosphatase superfamily)
MSNKTLTMMAVGDMVMSTPGELMFALAKPTLKTADVLVGQQEVPFTLRGINPYTLNPPPIGANDVVTGLSSEVLGISRTNRKPATRVVRRGIGNDPVNINALVDVGFDIIHLASNHTFDAGAPGVEDTLDGLHKAGIATAGTGMDLDEARRPAIVEREGTRFGLLSYNCEGPIGSWATPEKPGCAYVHVVTAYEQYELIGGLPTMYTFAEPGSLQLMVEDIQKLRPLCDVLVVHLHMGMAFHPVRLAMYEKQVSHAAVDAGADLIVGDHAHMLKGIEQYKGKWIFHNLGDFVFHLNPGPNPGSKNEGLARMIRDQGGPFFFGPGHTVSAFPDNPQRRFTIIVKCIIRNGKISQVSYLPCHPNEKQQIEILKHDKRGQEIFDYVENATRGAGLNARFKWKGDEVIPYIE